MTVILTCDKGHTKTYELYSRKVFERNEQSNYSNWVCECGGLLKERKFIDDNPYKTRGYSQ